MTPAGTVKIGTFINYTKIENNNMTYCVERANVKIVE